MHRASGGFRSPLQQLFLLEERVRLAGVRMPEEADQGRRFHGITCDIGGTDCVLNMQAVAEVFDDHQVTAIPGAAAWIEGLMNYRGTLVPVYRPHAYFRPAAEAGGDSRPGSVVVIRRDRRGLEFGAIRVNRLLGMRKFSVDDLLPADTEDAGPDTLHQFVDSVIHCDGKVWQRLDIGRLLDMMCGENPRRQ